MGYAGENAMAAGFGTARQRAVGWTESAFEAVFSEHYARLVGIVQRIVGERARAEELASDAFLKLYGQAGADSTLANVGGWLYRTAVRLGIDSLRSASRRRTYEPEAGPGLCGAAANPLDDVLRAERARLVRRTLHKLRPEQAELLALRADGMSYRELSSALGIKLASVGQALARAEAAFEKTYQRLNRQAGLK
jgi:RNA polymerase sigma-70 factor (ECF subfamily)